MKSAFWLICASLCVFVGVPGIKAAGICATANNLVANCGFETGDFTSWTLAGNDVPGQLGNLYGVEQADPFPLPGGTNPNSGVYQAFFADQAANPTTLSQLLTTPAALYQVSFYLSQQLVGPGTVNNQVVVSFGGSNIATLTNLGAQGNTFYSYIAPPGGPTATLGLQFGNDIGEFLLDDVSVTQAPEPASWELVVGGALLGGTIIRKRIRRRV